jgi:diguanylate cyclase (GGDEF)-like protein
MTWAKRLNNHAEHPITLVMTGSPRKHRTLSLLGALLVGLALLGAAAAMASPLDDRRSAVDERTAELELLRIRADLARVHRDELTHRILSPVVDLSNQPPGSARIDDVVATSLERLELLGDTSTPPGFAASSLHAVLTEWTTYPTVPEDALWDLMFFTDMARYEGVQPPAAESLEQLLFYDADITEILHEMAALQLDAAGVDDPLLVDLAESISPLVFAPDFVEPGVVSEFGGPALEANIEFYGWERRSDAEQTELHAWLVDLIAVTPVADYYSHLEMALAGETVHTPAEFQLYADELLRLNDMIRTRLDAELDADAAQLTTEHATVEERAALITLLRLFGGAILLVATAASVVNFVRRSRIAARQVSIDPLTGVGNRRALDDTARHLADSHHGFHLFAVIDLDRFKLVNDTHGHAVGDDLLVRVADGLQAIASTTAVQATTVVRQGGDEFLLSLHSASPINLPVVRTRLDDLRASSVSLPGGGHLELAFSYGLVSSTGRPDMTSLLRSADLAAYDDKARRRAAQPVIDLGRTIDVRADHTDELSI